MLHTVSRSPYQFDVEALLRSINTNDAVLLVQDGVTIAVKDNPLFQRLLDAGATVFVLREDLQARGLLQLVCRNRSVVNYRQYVELTVEHTPQLLW